MRALVLSLVLANLGYLGWNLFIDVSDQPPPTTAATEDAHAQRLMLLSERTAALAASTNLAEKTRKPHSPTHSEPAASSGATTAASVPASACISIGPFQDLASASQASATLKSAGHDPRQRLEQGQVWVGYWVSIPGYDNRDDAERAVARLKQYGMSDVYISLVNADSEASNVVSLGVFKDVDRAQRLLAEAKSMGFNAQITDRTRAGSVYWVDIDMRPSDPPVDFAALGAQPGKILRLEERACPVSPH